MMPQSDRLLEDVYDLIYRGHDEPTRLELARIAFLAVEYRAQQLKRQRTQRAVDRRAEERRALRANTQQSAGATASISAD